MILNRTGCSYVCMHFWLVQSRVHAFLQAVLYLATPDGVSKLGEITQLHTLRPLPSKNPHQGLHVLSTQPIRLTRKKNIFCMLMASSLCLLLRVRVFAVAIAMTSHLGRSRAAAPSMASDDPCVDSSAVPPECQLVIHNEGI